MKLSACKIFGFCLPLGGLAISLCAQSPTPFGNLPLWFEADGPGQFTARSQNLECSLSADGVGLTLQKADGEIARCRMQFVGARPAALTGAQPLTGRISHFNGRSPEQWRTGHPTYAQVRAEAIYPGVNVIYYGNQKTLEYDLQLAAGASPAAIALRFDGAEKISLDAQGRLILHLPGGEIVQHAPVASQTIAGVRREVSANYVILDAHTAAFALGDYDHRQPLVIDPVLSYSTYYGGSSGETAWAIAVNPSDGSVYVAGQTFSSKVTNGIPFITPDAYQTGFKGGKLTGDAFVARFDSTGSNLIYATYLGGTGNDGVTGIAVDAAGNAYLAGYTDSSNFPVKNALNGQINSSLNKVLNSYAVDVFVAELTPSGDDLVFSTYLGGNSMDAPYGLALDGANNVYVTGYTYSTNFPVTPNAYQSQLACSNSIYYNANAFLTVLAAGGGSLLYSTYLGGTNHDEGRAIALNNGRVFLAGLTYSTNFPYLNGLPENQFLNGDSHTNQNWKRNGCSDAFVAAFDAADPANLNLLYSSFLGGTNDDVATGIAADANGNAFVAGYTCSTNFPCTVANVPWLTPSFLHTNLQRPRLTTNAFLTRVNWDGQRAAIGYSAMFGGLGPDAANGVALDPDGNAYVTGYATSTNFPVTPFNLSPGLTATNNSRKNYGYSDAFVIAFNPDATALLYSTYLGGYLRDYGQAIAVDPLGNAYVAGQTFSANFPAVNARQPQRDGTNDVFLAKISQTTGEPSLRLVPVAAAAPKVAPNATPSAPAFRLQWRAFPAQYEVQSAPDLNAADWQTWLQQPVGTNGRYELLVPATNSAQFFRLHKN